LLVGNRLKNKEGFDYYLSVKHPYLGVCSLVCIGDTPDFSSIVFNESLWFQTILQIIYLPPKFR